MQRRQFVTEIAGKATRPPPPLPFLPPVVFLALRASLRRLFDRGYPIP